MQVEGFKSKIKIESDFEDYYDFLSNENEDEVIGVYRRYKCTEPRGKLLKCLRDKGIQTIELRAAREFGAEADKLVVYTNPTLHGSLGKMVMRRDEAKLMYSNNLAAKFYEEADGVTIKYLQIGSRRFRVTMRTWEPEDLSGGIVEDIEELDRGYNYLIQEPIFSIDYISDGTKMIAIDFNKPQRLEGLGIIGVMTPEEVIEEIKKALIKYNRI